MAPIVDVLLLPRFRCDVLRIDERLGMANVNTRRACRRRLPRPGCLVSLLHLATSLGRHIPLRSPYTDHVQPYTYFFGKIARMKRTFPKKLIWILCWICWLDIILG